MIQYCTEYYVEFEVLLVVCRTLSSTRQSTVDSLYQCVLHLILLSVKITSVYPLKAKKKCSRSLLEILMENLIETLSEIQMKKCNLCEKKNFFFGETIGCLLLCVFFFVCILGKREKTCLFFFLDHPLYSNDLLEHL